MVIKNVTQAERHNLGLRKLDDSFQKRTHGRSIQKEKTKQISNQQDRKVGYEQSNLNITNQTSVNTLKYAQPNTNVVSTSFESATSSLSNKIAALKGQYGSITTGESIQKQELPAIEEDTPTYVATDPDKPSNISVSVSVQPTINVLPKETPYIDVTQNKYKAYKNDLIESDIIGQTNDGFIVQKQSTDLDQLSSYHYIVSDDLEVQSKVYPNEFNSFTPVVYDNVVSGEDPFNHMQIAYDVPTEEFLKYKYRFGFNDICVQKRELNTTAGYISEDIIVKDCQYIELNAPIINGIEYSILDGDEEFPVLPIGQTKIVGEKLFYGLRTRFTITDDTSIEVYKNLTESVAIHSTEDLNLFLTVNNTEEAVNQSSFSKLDLYTINYTPDIKAQQYTPKSTRIKLKIIQRYYGSDVPAPIKDISIRKYGISTTWYLSSFDESNHYVSYDWRR